MGAVSYWAMSKHHRKISPATSLEQVKIQCWGHRGKVRKVVERVQPRWLGNRKKPGARKIPAKVRGRGKANR